MCCVPLVVECEWGSYGYIKEDFQKLLLARADVRLMIYRDNGRQDATQTAKQLARHVKKFNRSHAEDAWLLAARIDDDPGFAFMYFTIRNGQVFRI